MLILRLFQVVALWGLALVVWAHAWMASSAATAYDSRVPWGVAVGLGAWLAGTLAGALLSWRWPARWPALDAHRHALALLVTALCVDGLSHVAPQVSIRVLREEVPPFLGVMYPALCALTPLLLRASKPTHDFARQLLLATIFATAMSGALLFLAPPVALGLALLALAWQFDGQGGFPPRGALLLCAALVVLLLLVAGRTGYSALAAGPSMAWVLALGALGLAIAVRPRDERAWRQLFGAGVLAAVLVALCGAALTAYLADVIAWQPAVHSRLLLFRQHPNFLAPFFGFHAVLALALAVARPRSGVPWFLAAVLLGAAAWLTDSRTGFAAMLGAAALLPTLGLLARLRRHVRLPVVAGAVLAGALLLGGGWLLAGGDGAVEKWTSGVNRFEKSLDFRLDAWRNSLAIIRQHPWLGLGPHTFVVVEDFAPGSRFFNTPEAPHPHNVFLYVAQAAGLPALLLFLGWTGALLFRLWRRSVEPPDAVPAALGFGLLAALLGLLVGNLFDLGLALETVVPAPLILFTGLALSSTAPRPVPAPRWHPLACGVALWVLFVPLVLQPVRALTAVQQAELLAYDSGQLPGAEGLMNRARATLEHALELDPAVPKAHALLSRWREDVPGGFAGARDVLVQLIALAPHDSTGHSLLGRLLLHNALWAEAEGEYAAALEDLSGSETASQDRADRIVCLARQGRREDAYGALVDALRLDSGVMYRLPWIDPAARERRLAVGGSEPQQPLELLEALERLFARHVADHEALRPVGYAFWMDTYRAFRTVGRDDRARQVLDYMEAHVTDVEPFTIASERGNLAFDSGQLDLALPYFERAYELSRNPFYLTRAAQVRRAMGQTVAAEEQGDVALQALVEILDQPVSFSHALDAQVENELTAGRPADAAATLYRSLLFEDDLLARARLLERVGDLAFAGGDVALGERALREALMLLAAKPFPWRMLEEGGTDSLPGRIGRTLCRSWRARGLDQAARFRELWGLPSYSSARMGPSLCRLGFFYENAQVDQLLREAEIQLLTDRTNLLAHWARLFALEASGRHLELGMAMRSLVDHYGLTASAQSQFDALARVMKDRLGDPQAWFRLGLLTMLRGKYDQAVGMFENGRQQLPDDPTAAAGMCGWEALAAYLASEPEAAHAALLEGSRLDPSNELLRLRLAVIPPESSSVLPPPTETPR